MVTILIADDHPIIRRGIRNLLEETGDILAAAEAENGTQVLDHVRTGQFDIVLLDLSMPDMSGMDIIKQIKKEKPEVKILVLSRYPEEQFAIPALRAGASGYLSKTILAEELINAIHAVAAGKNYISAALADQMASQLQGRGGLDQAKLSDREPEVLCLIAAGEKIMEIAEELCISETTVSTYRSRLISKLDVKNDADLIRYAIENDLV